MRYEVTLGKADQDRYGESVILDYGKLDNDTEAETLIEWEEEANYTLHLLKLRSDIQPTTWRRAVVWFALKQAGSDIRFADIKLMASGGMEFRLIPEDVDAGPPDETHSPDPSEPAS